MGRERQMNKRILMSAAVVLTVMLVWGCHGKVKSVAFSVPNSFDTGKKYEITF